MSTLTQGILVFVLFTSVVTGIMLMTLLRARQQGLSGSALLQRLLPYLVADGLFMVVFVVWLLNEL